MLAPEIKIIDQLLVAVRNRVAVDTITVADRSLAKRHFAFANRDRVAVNAVVAIVFDCGRRRGAADDDLRRLLPIEVCDIDNH